MRSIQRRVVDRDTKNAWTRGKKRERQRKRREENEGEITPYITKAEFKFLRFRPRNERLTGNEKEREREKTDIVVGRGEERRGWNAHKEADRGISHKARNLEATMNESWRSEGGENGI